MLCVGAKKRMTKAIESLVQATRFDKQRIINPVTGKTFDFQLSFMTLTISTTTTNIKGKEAHKRCLEPFLRWMRETHKCKLYVWKAELQRRGQLHYHITSNCYIDKAVVKEKWNSLQQAAGYTDTYFRRYGSHNPPSTEIKAVWKEKNLAGYLCKEFAKSYQNSASIGGKVWDCSVNLKAINLYTCFADSGYDQRLGEAIAKKQVKMVVTEQCIIYKMITRHPHDFLSHTDFVGFNKQMNLLTGSELQRAKPKKKEPVTVAPVRERKHIIRHSWRVATKMIARDCVKENYFEGGLQFDSKQIFDFPDIKQKIISNIFVLPDLFSTS